MLDIYEVNGIWYVTYQRDTHAAIDTLYEGENGAEAEAVCDEFLKKWE